MSTYGPAFFIKRKNNQEISQDEQKKLLAHVIKFSEKLNIEDDKGDAVQPDFYDYDGYEDKSVGYLIYASMIWNMMPDEVQQEQEEGDEKKILKIGKKLDELFPDTYEYKCYYVES